MATVSLNVVCPDGDEADVVFEALLTMAPLVPGAATDVFVSDGAYVERP